MSLPARLATAAVAALLGVALVPLAAASTGHLVSLSASYAAPTEVSGGQPLFAYADKVDPTEGQAEAPLLHIEVHAASARAIAYATTSLEQPAGGYVGTENDPTHPPTRDVTDLTQGVLQSVEVQRGLALHVYGLGGTLAVAGNSGGGQLSVLRQAAVGTGGLDDASTIGGPEAGASPDFPEFARVASAGPVVLQHDLDPALTLTFTGDMVVEARGLSLTARNATVDKLVDGRVWSEPMAPGTPNLGVVYREHTGFARLFLHDATLVLSSEGGRPSVHLAAPQLGATTAGPVTFFQAQGAVTTARQAAQVDETQYVLAAPASLALTPQGQQLATVISEPPVHTQGTIASVPAPASAALLGTGAVLALLAAVAIGLVRKLLRLPALADVERAIEEGEYARAARLAARILARLPGAEDALLGRAIALSKNGEPQRVVAELGAHLATRPASDGALHYVLGLAQLEVGQTAAAQASLREAVRLTPSLQAEVAPRLGKAFSPPHPTPKESPHGYA